MEYDSNIPTDALTAIEHLFAQDSLIVPKKSKNGIQEQDIIPMLRRFEVRKIGENELVLDCVLCCQNPALNPMQLALAIDMYLPDCKPNFTKCSRIEVFDNAMTVFR